MVCGLVLIGQNFIGNGYFYGCLLVMVEMFYNLQVFGGSNLVVSNFELDKLIVVCVVVLWVVNLDVSVSVLVELVMVLVSGLDNNIIL